MLLSSEEAFMRVRRLNFDAVCDLGNQVIQETYLSVYAAIVQEDFALLAFNSRGPYQGTWGLIGGGIEFGETPETALHREIWEEAGAKIQNSSLQDVQSYRTEYIRQDGIRVDFHHIAVLYRVVLACSLPKIIVSPDPTEQVQWFALEELIQIPLNPFAHSFFTSDSMAEVFE
jgi:8-oxo-dGTP diphosphatase